MTSTTKGYETSVKDIDLSHLKKELEKTEDEISRQKLKMALNKKTPKHFEIGKQHH